MRPVTVTAMARPDPAGRPPRPPAAAASERGRLGVLLAVTVALMALLTVSAGPHATLGGPKLLPTLAVCVPIVALRRWPLPVLAATTVATAVLVASGAAALPFSLAIGLAMYGTAASRPRRVSIPAAAAAAAGLSAGVVYAAFAVRTAHPYAEIRVNLIPLAAAWFIGDSTAARRRYLAGLAEQAERERAAEAERAEQERAAEVERAQRQVREERVRIAHELHDVVAHTLTVITVQAGVGRRLMAKRPEAAGSALESIEMIGRTAQDELRVVLGLLREECGGAALAPAPKLADLNTHPDQPVTGARVGRGGRPARRAVIGGLDPHLAAGDGQPDLGARPRPRIAAFGGELVAGPLDGGGFRVRATVPAEGAG